MFQIISMFLRSELTRDMKSAPGLLKTQHRINVHVLVQLTGSHSSVSIAQKNVGTISYLHIGSRLMTLIHHRSALMHHQHDRTTILQYQHANLRVISNSTHTHQNLRQAKTSIQPKIFLKADKESLIPPQRVPRHKGLQKSSLMSLLTRRKKRLSSVKTGYVAWNVSLGTSVLLHMEKSSCKRRRMLHLAIK